MRRARSPRHLGLAVLLLAGAPAAWGQFTLGGISTTMSVMSTLQGINANAMSSSVNAANRLALRGQRPGTEGSGPVESGNVDILGADPATVEDGQPNDPFTALPDPSQSLDPAEGKNLDGEDPFSEEPDPSQTFDPSEGTDMESEDPFNEEPDPSQTFDPSEGTDMDGEDPFNEEPDPSQTFNPSEGMDMEGEDPFSEEPDPGQSFDPSEGMDMEGEDPFSEEPDPGQSFDPSEGMDLGAEDPFDRIEIDLEIPGKQEAQVEPAETPGIPADK